MSLLEIITTTIVACGILIVSMMWKQFQYATTDDDPDDADDADADETEQAIQQARERYTDLPDEEYAIHDYETDLEAILDDDSENPAWLTDTEEEEDDGDDDDVPSQWFRTDLLECADEDDSPDFPTDADRLATLCAIERRPGESDMELRERIDRLVATEGIPQRDPSEEILDEMIKGTIDRWYNKNVGEPNPAVRLDALARGVRSQLDGLRHPHEIYIHHNNEYGPCTIEVQIPRLEYRKKFAVPLKEPTVEPATFSEC